MLGGADQSLMCFEQMPGTKKSHQRYKQLGKDTEATLAAVRAAAADSPQGGKEEAITCIDLQGFVRIDSVSSISSVILEYK